MLCVSFVCILLLPCLWRVQRQRPGFPLMRISCMARLRPVPRLPPLAPGLGSSDGVELPASGHLQQEAVVLVKGFRGTATASLADVGSARLEEERERKQLAILWLACARQVAAHSDSLRLLTDFQPEQLLPLFLDRAVSTLKRHLVGWRTWSNFCMTLGWSAGSPFLQQLLDFLQCLVDGSLSDRGKSRRRSALGVLSAMTFAAHKLSLSGLLRLLDQPLVLAWKRAPRRQSHCHLQR